MMRDLFREGRDIDAARARRERDGRMLPHWVVAPSVRRFLPLFLGGHRSCRALLLIGVATVVQRQRRLLHVLARRY
jgi:hypothetical protein